MNILITIDDNYLEPAFNMLYSLKHFNNKLIIYIIYDNLSQQSIDRLSNFINNNIGDLYFYYFDSKMLGFDEIKSEYITKTCYFRLFAPYIINDIDRLLYLDPDIVCQGSIDELYNVDLEDNIVAACPNMLREDVSNWNDICLMTLQLPLDTNYVNSGVLLMDINKYKNFISLEYLIKFIQEKNTEYNSQDQDILNKLFYNRIKVMDNKYNYQINATDRQKINFNNILIHYSEAKKPWKDDYLDTYRAIPYYKVLHLTGQDTKLESLIIKHSLNNAYAVMDLIKNGNDKNLN